MRMQHWILQRLCNIFLFFSRTRWKNKQGFEEDVERSTFCIKKKINPTPYFVACVAVPRDGY